MLWIYTSTYSNRLLADLLTNGNEIARLCLESPEYISGYYDEKYQGRKLYWQHSFWPLCSEGEVLRGSHEFNVSLFQASILVLFNNFGGDDKLTYREIKELVGIEDNELKRTLQSLACSKIRPLKKRPKGKEVKEDDYFIV